MLKRCRVVKKMPNCQKDVKMSKRCQNVQKMSKCQNNVKKSNSRTEEEVHKKKVDTMRFTHNDLSFDATYESNQN